MCDPSARSCRTGADGGVGSMSGGVDQAMSD